MRSAREITASLGGRWHGASGSAACPVCQPERRKDQNALSLSDGSNGLLVFCHRSGCAFRDVLQAVGVAPGEISDPASIWQNLRRAPQENVAKRADQAARIWQHARPVLGTLAETYLRKRAITAELPDTLRYAPDCWHGVAKRELPALIARVDGGATFAVHRTYLHPDGCGKAKVDPPKVMLGSVAGGAIKLSSAAGPLVVAEGIETALSLVGGLMSETAEVWATMSTSGMRSLVLPHSPGALIIASDGDNAGQTAACALADRAHALGWTVSLLPAPEGLDWNDVLVNRGNAA